MSLFPPNLEDWTEYRPMVHWFSPVVLLKTLEKVLAATLFARYADRRLVHAALDSPIDHNTLIDTCCGGIKGICGNSDRSEHWIDYVADLGDGFDSTYAIAYLIGRKSIVVDEIELPRADCLIMGGDEVYPDASPEDYHTRMQRPYRAAFPRNEDPGSPHPPVFMIPGNHDWYDGLTLFLAKFCNGRSNNYLGSWIASQRRSYFAVHFTNNWWIWGFDSQLGEDVDKPQSDYFEAVAAKMPSDAKIILCASVPTWLRASLAATNKKEERDLFYRGLDFIAEIARKRCKGAKIPLVLAGDLHHYSRYVSRESGTNFITAGGGGAFLHPTHDLVQDELEIKWAQTIQTLEIGTTGTLPGADKSIFPSREKSRELAFGNLLFCYKNWDFCLVLGFLYLCCSLFMLSWQGYYASGGQIYLVDRIFNQLNVLWPTPIFLLIVISLCILIVRTADIRSPGRKYFIGLLHSSLHIGLALVGAASISILSFTIAKGLYFLSEIVYFLLLVVGMLLLGFVGGFFWGLYLTIVSWMWGDEANSAFSAMRLDSYKNFLRLKIEGDILTVFPIGLEKSPVRSMWKMNEDFDDDHPHQDTPAIVPIGSLEQHLIENPIIIDIKNIKPLQ